MPVVIRKISLFCSLRLFSPTSLQRAKNAYFSLIFPGKSAFWNGFKLRRFDVKKDFFFDLFLRFAAESSSDNFRFLLANSVSGGVGDKTRNQFGSNATWVRIPPSAPIITTQVLHWVVIFYCRFHLCWGSATGQITNERHHFMQDPSPILRTPPILSSIASLGSVQIIPANCPKSYSRNCTRISGLVWNKFYKSHCNLPMKKAPRHPSSKLHPTC